MISTDNRYLKGKNYSLMKKISLAAYSAFLLLLIITSIFYVILFSNQI